MNYRYAIIVVLTFALVQLIYVAINRKTVSDKLHTTVSQLNSRSTIINKIDLSFESIFIIENSFRMYLNTREPQYFQNYKDGLLLLTNSIDSIQHYRESQTPEKGVNLKSVIDNRARNSALFIRLTAVNDSLLLATKNLATLDEKQRIYYKPLKLRDVQTVLSQTADTAVKVNESKKKSIFNRIGDAIANKESNSNDTIITKNNLVLRIKETQDSLSLIKLNRLFKSSINALVANNENIKRREQAIINDNSVLLNELSSLLRELKAQEARAENLYGEKLIASANDNLTTLNRDSQIVLVLALLLALIIVFNAWRLHSFEEKLKQAKNLAVHQTHEKNAYLAHLSHEIRTPLNSIIGFSDQLVKPNLSEKEQASYLDAVKTSSQMLLSLVNDILDFSKIEVGKVTLSSEKFRPYTAINDVIKALIILAKQKNLKLTVEYSISSDLVLVGDEHRFKQVLINLVNNAIKFTDKGSITVSCKLLGPSTINLEVADTGCGIEKKNFGALFEEFSQLTDNNLENKKIGTGLGLSITKKIIEAQKGSITVQSEFGKGSRFIVEIPYQPVTSNQIDVTDNSLVRNSLEAIDWASLPIKKVLIVDDSVLNIKLLKVILERKSINCDDAENGEIAYQLYLKNEYDVILTDIQMPILNGVELTKKIRSHSDHKKSEVPIVAITANAISEDLNEYLAEGMNGHLLKPFNEQTLYHSLNKLVSDGAIKIENKV